VGKASRGKGARREREMVNLHLGIDLVTLALETT